MLAKLGDVKDIMDIFESFPEIQSVSCLPNSLQHPERANKPIPELPSTCQVKCFRREQNLFSYLMFLQSVVLVETTLLVLLGLLEMILSPLDKLLDVLYKVSNSRSSTLTSQNSINR